MTVVPAPVPAPVHPAPDTNVARSVEGRNAVADRNRHAPPDTLAGLSNINSVLRNNIGEQKRHLSLPVCEFIKNKFNRKHLFQHKHVFSLLGFVTYQSENLDLGGID